MKESGISAAPERLVSVIVPAYNAARHLARTLDSILQQSWSAWEAIVVNDGSTDETPALIEQYAQRDPRIRPLHQSNRGLSGARNSGLRAMRGDFVQFLDADDLLYPQRLAQSIAAFDAHPSWDAVVCHAVMIDEEDRPLLLPRRRAAHLANHRRMVAWFLQRPLEVLLLGNLFPPHAPLFRRRAFDGLDGFDEQLRSLEDFDLWIRMLVAGRVFGDTPECGVGYRRYGGSMSANVTRMDENWTRVLEQRFRAMPKGTLADPASSFRLACCAKDLRLARACLASYKSGDAAFYVARAEENLIENCGEPMIHILRTLAATAPGGERILRRLGADAQEVLAHRFHVAVRTAKNKRTAAAWWNLARLCAAHPWSAQQAAVRLLRDGAIVD